MPIKRILVADDEESIRWVLSKALKKQGFIVDLAEDGSQARALAGKITTTWPFWTSRCPVSKDWIC